MIRIESTDRQMPPGGVILPEGSPTAEKVLNLLYEDRDAFPEDSSERKIVERAIGRYPDSQPNVNA